MLQTAIVCKEETVVGITIKKMKLLKLLLVFCVYIQATVGSHLKLSRHSQTIARNPTISLPIRKWVRNRVSTLPHMNQVLGSNLWSRRLPTRHTGSLNSRTFGSINSYFGRSRSNRLNPVQPQLLQRHLIDRTRVNIQNRPVDSRHSQSHVSGHRSMGQASSRTTTADPTLSDSPLMLLINSREISARSQAEEEMLSHYLLALERISAADRTNALRNQLRYIDEIQDPDMKRETLKLFVKDMVEKSGFLSPSTDSSTIDTREMMTLHDTIQEITDRFNRHSVASVDNINIDTSEVAPINSINPSLNINRPLSRDKINAALSSYSGRNAIQDVSISQSQSHFPSSNALNTFGSSGRSNGVSATVAQRNRIRDQVGKSIFGGHSVPSFTVPITRATSNSPEVTSIGKREFRGKVMDMLCAMCQDKFVLKCINNYCLHTNEDAN